MAEGRLLAVGVGDELLRPLAGWEVVRASPEEVQPLSQRCDVVLLGPEVLDHRSEVEPPVVALVGRREEGVRLLREGVWDFLVLPVEREELELVLQRALRVRRLLTAPLREVLERRISPYLQRLARSRATGALHRLVMREVERALLEAVMRHVGGNKVQAARILGINRNTLRRKLLSLRVRA